MFAQPVTINVGYPTTSIPDNTPIWGASTGAVASSSTYVPSTPSAVQSQPGVIVSSTTSAAIPTRVHTSTSSSAATSVPASAGVGHGSASPSTLSAGAVAGIAIGCILAGLAIGLLAACLLLKRKYRRRAAVDGAVPHAESKPYADSGGTTWSDIQLGQFLLDATSDKDIAREVQSLGGLIRQHVENNYHTDPVTVDMGTLEQSLVQLGFTGDNEPPRGLIMALCIDPKTRYAGLQHVILRVIFACINVDPRGPCSLLPPPAAAFLQSIPTIEAQQQSGLSGKWSLIGSKASNTDQETEAFLLAVSKWRVLSAFLLHPNRGMRTALPADRGTALSQARALAIYLDSFLNNFVSSDSGVWQAQESHLEAVIMECTKLGYVLFSHPSEWRVVTEETPSKTKRETGRTVIVEAGLEKLSDRFGVLYSSPKRVVDPVVVSC